LYAIRSFIINIILVFYVDSYVPMLLCVSICIDAANYMFKSADH